MYEIPNRDLERRYKISDFPLNVAIEVTNNCNLNCIMCHNDIMKRPKGYMPMGTYKKIIDEIVKENPHTRIWLDFYGEALLAGWKLYYMVDYAKKRGCTNVCINTNGTLMKQEYADMLLDSNVDYISLDCDGFSEEVYEKIRVNASRDVFYNNVEYLLAEKKRRNHPVIVDIKVIDMPENHHEIDQIVDYWQKRGAWTAVRRCGEWVSNGGGQSDSKNRIACGISVGVAAISWDGNVAGCAWDYDCDMAFGNINEKSLKDIWQRRNNDFVSKHFAHRWQELPAMCQNCDNWRNIGEMRYDENGKNRERNYEQNGSIYK